MKKDKEKYLKRQKRCYRKGRMKNRRRNPKEELELENIAKKIDGVGEKE